MKIYLYKNDEQFGPYTLEQVQAFIETKSFRPTDSAWYEGGEEWTTLSQVPGVVFTPENLHQHLVPPFEAYTGDQPYIFISYAHADGEVVFREIKRLHEAGYRIWYDEGIEPGNDWPQHIAQAVVNCSLFLIYTSPRSAASENCRNEINLALNRKKKFLAIHMEETELPLGLELRMGDLQAILKYKLPQATYQKKVYASLEKLLGSEGREQIQGNDPVAVALAQKTDSEELVAPVASSSLSRQTKQKQKRAESKNTKAAEKKGRKKFWFGLAASVIALLIVISLWEKEKEPDNLSLKSQVSESLNMANSLPSIFQGRAHAEKIDPTKKKAIDKALDWLSSQQKADGRWTDEDSYYAKQKSNIIYFEQAYTGLALMNLLAKEPSFTEGKYIESKNKALEFLISIPGKVEIGQGNSSCYAHPMRTQALCEAYLINKDQKLLKFLGPAVQSVINGQNENGGWAYLYGKGQKAHTDLSVTGWNVQAVKMASYLDLPFIGIKECLQKASSFAQRCQVADGRFSYQIGGKGKRSLTGAGAYCLALTGSKNSIGAFKAMNYIIFNQPSKLPELDNYEFYYNSLAFEAAPLLEGGSDYANKWKVSLPTFLLSAQNEAGFWEQGKHFHGEDQLFRTLLMLLSLQSEYRYAYN
ncbi:MAG: TIR domain-containing protein [Opitutales bacterium]